MSSSGGPSGSSGSGGGSPTIVTGVSPEQRPLNLLNAVSDIQQISAVERGMTNPLDKNYLTVQQRVDFFVIGVKNALTHFLFTLFFTPLTVGVLHNLIHIFGDRQLTWFDEAYALVLAFSISLGFGFFLASLRDCYVGTLSKGMIRNLFSGLAVGEFVKLVLSAIIYQIIYILLTPNSVASLLLSLNNHFGGLMAYLHVNYTAMYYWILKFRGVFPISTVFIFISSFFMVGIPIIALLISTYKKRKYTDDLDDEE